MKQHFVRALATAGFLIATVFGATGHAQAQSLATPVRVRIPFDFVVGEKTFAAGEYLVERLESSSGDAMVVVRGLNDRTKLVRLSNSVQSREPKEQATLVFNRYGNQSFLEQVWPAGATTGRQLTKSHSERKLERQARDIVRVEIKSSPAAETVNIIVGR